MGGYLKQKTTARVRNPLAANHLQFDSIRPSVSLRCCREWVEHCSLPIAASTLSTSEYSMRIDSSLPWFRSAQNSKPHLQA
jgi:hypothetical protein